MRVGILTLFHNNDNYGAVLQAYALNRVLRYQGHEVKTITYDAHHYGFISKVKFAFRFHNKIEIFRHVIKLMKKFFFRASLRQNMNSKKADAFAIFKEKYIPHTKEVYDDSNLTTINAIFDAFVCGSDMVWHLGCADISTAYWLKFAASSKKRVSYAASMSQKTIDSIQQKQIQETLPTFDAVSVRESSSVDLLNRCLEKPMNIDWVLDPVFLLTAEDWQNTFLLKGFSCDYICVYLLSPSSKTVREINEYSRVIGKRVRLIPTDGLNSANCPAEWDCMMDEAPVHFINTLMGASVVITDSYHGFVFSLIFNREVFSVLRFSSSSEHDNSRIESLMKMLPVQSCVLSNNFSHKELLIAKPLDYKKINSVLALWRKNSLQFLRESLEN